MLQSRNAPRLIFPGGGEEGSREGGREGEREGGRREKEGGRDVGRKGGREGRREEGRENVYNSTGDQFTESKHSWCRHEHEQIHKSYISRVW